MLCQLINDRFCFSSEHSYSVVDSKTWKRKLDQATEKSLKIQRKEIMSLQPKLSEAYEKFTIDQEKQHHISNAADLIPSKLFKNSLDNQRDYGESIQKFALTFKVRINVVFLQF